VPAGREVGDYLINRPEIDKVSFTGSVAGGKRIAEVCAKRLARYTLELGGKSPAVIMDDADLSAALGAIVPFSMPMTGQICFFADAGAGFEKTPRRSRRCLQAGSQHGGRG
jgi:acyl-CoA reductase-like NAD-dependent aldehyde dehydrogenase